MKCDYLIRAIGCLDGEFIDEAENYKPARKNHAWIWAAASAACVMLVVGAFILRKPVAQNACLRSIFAAVPAHEYVDYSETAEKGKVTMTDELKAEFDECEEPPAVLFGDSNMCGWIFNVHITDADGGSRYHILKNCIQPLNIGEGKEEDFLQTGNIELTKKQIFSMKCPPDCTIIIAPSMIILNEEYLATVTRDTLYVRVYAYSGDRALDDWEEEKARILKFFNEYTERNKVDRESITEYSESSGVFRAELDKATISRLLADERTEMVCFITDG
ncbi:MAG: hypothetical protein HDT43_08225 [Ruminococcaceae bacterium]|nr:hypothetical protein [Oscillospiraceae bacterium]